MSWALIPLTEEQREIQRTARDFGQAEIAPYSDAWDRAEKYDEAIVGKAFPAGREQVGDGHQDLVSHLVGERVIDPLEVVEVDDGHGEGG